MQQGTSVSVTVDSRQKWNATGIALAAGGRYRFRAAGEWRDWTITCDANGYESANLVQRLTECLRRAPRERWFALIGSIGCKGDQLFLIGTDSTYNSRVTGELFCFANDVSAARFNNHGKLELTVTRVD